MSVIMPARPGAMQDSPTGLPATLNFRIKGTYVEDVMVQERAAGPPLKSEGALTRNPYSRNGSKEVSGQFLGEG